MKLHPLEQQPTQIDFKTVDGMFVKQILIYKAGTLIPQHAHVLDHTSLLATGQIMVRQSNKDWETYQAPSIIFIPAQQEHEFLTLTDNTLLYCLHNLHHGNAPQILREHQLDI